MRTLDGKFFIFSQGRQSRLQKRRSRRGQTLVEYALILAVISIVAISVLLSMGQNVKSLYTMIDSQVARGVTGS